MSKTSNVTMSAITFSSSTNGAGATTWTYSFTVDMTDNNAGEILFSTRLLAGAHNFTGASLQIKGAGTLSFIKPTAAPGAPNLVLTKTALTAVAPGQTMTYTLSYQNTASGSGATNQATGVQITDVLPAEVTYVPNSCTGCTYDALSRTLSWELGAIPAGSALATKTYQVTVGTTLTNNTQFTNDAKILSAENDANVANNASKVTTTVFTPSISGTVLTDPNGDGTDQGDGSGLAGATITLYVDTNTNGTYNAGTDLQVGAPITTPSSGEWAFTSGLVKNTTYFVRRTNPSGYTSTKAIAEAVAAATDHSTATATAGTDDELKVVFDNAAASQFSSNNKFLATQQSGTVSGTIYNDADGSGTLTTGDTALGSGIAVALSGTSSASTTTGGSGLYSFSGLAAGTYDVNFTLPAGYASTSTKPLTGISLVAGATSTGHDFFARRTTSTTLALTTGTNPSSYGDSLTFTATVTSAAGNPGSLGSVTFKDGVTTLCSAVALVGNQATCSVSDLSVADSPHSITAEYSGTNTAPGFSGSTSSPLSQSVSRASSTTVVTCPASVTYTGSPLTPCTVAVTGAGGLNLTPAPSYTNNTNAGTAIGQLHLRRGRQPRRQLGLDDLRDRPGVLDDDRHLPGERHLHRLGPDPVHGLRDRRRWPQPDPDTHLLEQHERRDRLGQLHLRRGRQPRRQLGLDDLRDRSGVLDDHGELPGERHLHRLGAHAVHRLGDRCRRPEPDPDPDLHHNTNAGTATASYTFAGDANHTGSSDSKTFTIDQASSTTVVTCPASVTYTGSAQTPCTAAVTGAGGLNLTPTPSYTNNTNAGTASASYTFAGDANHTGSNGLQELHDRPGVLDDDRDLPGERHLRRLGPDAVHVSVTGAGGLSLTPTPTYTNNTNAGTATASYTYAGDANHTGSTTRRPSTIAKAVLDHDRHLPGQRHLQRLGPDAVHRSSVTGAGGLSLTPTPTYTNNTNAGTATASYTYAGDANHTGSNGLDDLHDRPGRLDHHGDLPGERRPTTARRRRRAPRR